jgi:hypothetical protein
MDNATQNYCSNYKNQFSMRIVRESEEWRIAALTSLLFRLEGDELSRKIITKNMQSNIQPVSKRTLWVGYIVSALPVLLLFSAVLKLMKPVQVVEGFAHFGFPEDLVFKLGILELFCTAVYLIPRTAVLGAILITGYFGGAVVTNARLGESFLVPLIAGMLIWGGLYVRDLRVRALIPLRREPSDMD